MTITIRTETFKADGTHTYERKDYRSVHEVGTVEVDLGNQTVTLRAGRFKIGEGRYDISVAGFVGRYQTSSKAWPAMVYHTEGEEHTQASFGRDDRSGRFHKMRGISYEPETFAKVGNPDWYEAN